MKEDILPTGFNGTFYFTNFSTEEFKARWNKKEYTFPPESTVPLIILDATPSEVQNIRKKFAKELAEREFFKTQRYASFEAQNPKHSLNSFRVAIGYNENELNDFVSKCLEPLKIEAIKVHQVNESIDHMLHVDEKGAPVSPVVDQNTSLAVGSPV